MSYAAVSMGIFIFILAYFTINAPKPATPKPPEPEVQTTEYCELADPATSPTFKAPADNVMKVGTDDIDPSAGEVLRGVCGSNRHQIGQETTYRLIRKNVPMSTTDVQDHNFNWDDSSCHFDTAESLGINIPEIDTAKFKVFYPEISGEINLKKPLYSRTRQGERSLMYLIDYGLVFLLHINPDGSLTELKGGTTEGESEIFVLVDVYQDVNRMVDNPLPEEALACDTTKGAGLASGKQVTIPNQNTQDPDQLQLQYFVFGEGASSGQIVNGWGIHCKPAVYLYPPNKQLVNVKVTPSGFLTYVDPPYDNEKGWTVYAYPDGSLSAINDERLTNNYLYFESKIRDDVIKKPTKGWVVRGSSIKGQVSREMEDLFKKILPQLGLNEKQKTDFIEYWNKALSKDPSPYYFVGVIDQDNVNEIERLEITPKPDYVNRVRIYFERLDQFKQVEAPTIQTMNDERLTMNDFRVVEWGGMVKNDPSHPFTCSQ